MKNKVPTYAPILAILVLTAVLVTFFGIELYRLKNRDTADVSTLSGQATATSASGSSAPATSETHEPEPSTTPSPSAVTAASAATGPSDATTPASSSAAPVATDPTAPPTRLPTSPKTAAPTAATAKPPTPTQPAATTGQHNAAIITPEQAQAIAIDKVGKSAILQEFKSELDNHPPKYDVTLTMGDYEYKLEIHAVTGAIIDFEKDELPDRSKSTTSH